MFLRRLFLSCAVLSVGLWWPVAHRSQAWSQTPAAVSAPADADVSADSVDAMTSTFVEPQLEIEQRFSPVRREDTLEYRFSGVENEIVVVYAKLSDVYEPGAVDLFLKEDLAQAGTELTPVLSDLYYPDFVDSDEYEGTHVAFRLPATGEYSLQLDASLIRVSGNLLRVRSASYYERLMMAAVEKQVVELYDDAARLAGLAIAQRPEQAAPYITRLTTYIGKVVATSTVLDDLTAVEDPSEIIRVMYAGFLTLAAEEQALVIDDLRQVARVYEGAIANSALANDDFSAADFIGISDFLETGVPNAAVERVLFEADR